MIKRPHYQIIGLLVFNSCYSLDELPVFLIEEITNIRTACNQRLTERINFLPTALSPIDLQKDFKLIATATTLLQNVNTQLTDYPETSQTRVRAHFEPTIIIIKQLSEVCYHDLKELLLNGH